MHHTTKTSKTSNTLKKEEGDLKVQNSPRHLQLSGERIKSITRLAGIAREDAATEAASGCECEGWRINAYGLQAATTYLEKLVARL